MNATQHFGLFQGIIDDPEGDAVLIGTFSTDERAGLFRDLISAEHTELKRAANEDRERGETPDDVPDLYWDIRPVAFDPRSLDELI